MIFLEVTQKFTLRRTSDRCAPAYIRGNALVVVHGVSFGAEGPRDVCCVDDDILLASSVRG